VYQLIGAARTSRKKVPGNVTALCPDSHNLFSLVFIAALPVQGIKPYPEVQITVKTGMDGQKEDGEQDCDEPCEQCGLCCRIFGDSITPTAETLFGWIERGRQDILRYFSACKTDGSWVNCSDLAPDELHDVVTVEMRDPVTHDYLAVCPFLRHVGRKRYLCGIHDIKPDMCGTYQPWIWGETYFNKCRALKKLNGKNRGPE
jgi:Fe-S-cluster containining protein